MGKRKNSLIFLMLFLGVAVLLWPALRSLVRQRQDAYAIQKMHRQLDTMDIAQQCRLAEEYNAKLLASGEKMTQEEYNGILDVDDGMMGYLEIPKLGTYLPIYHGTEEAVLAKGVGHLEGSALPIGGEGNHSVLAGHTGFPGAELFTDLTELAEGDIFCVTVLDRTLTYEVDQVKVVLPGEGQDLAPVPGEDYCTLVTCTPYGVNSHRLLVRGKRMEAEQEETQPLEEAQQERSALGWLLLLALGLPLMIAGVLLAVIRRRRQ